MAKGDRKIKLKKTTEKKKKTSLTIRFDVTFFIFLSNLSTNLRALAFIDHILCLLFCKFGHLFC